VIRALPRVTPVDHYRAPLAQRLPSWAFPAAGVTAVVLVIALAIATISARHRANAAEQAACAAKVETFYVRNPKLRIGTVRLADHCSTLATLGQ
jgi:hypothetical protein